MAATNKTVVKELLINCEYNMKNKSLSMDSTLAFRFTKHFARKSEIIVRS